MSLETESTTTDLKTYQAEESETKEVVVTQERELGFLCATVQYLESRVCAFSVIILEFQEESTAAEEDSDGSLNGEYEMEFDINLD